MRFAIVLLLLCACATTQPKPPPPPQIPAPLPPPALPQTLEIGDSSLYAILRVRDIRALLSELEPGRLPFKPSDFAAGPFDLFVWQAPGDMPNLIALVPAPADGDQVQRLRTLHPDLHVEAFQGASLLTNAPDVLSKNRAQIEAAITATQANDLQLVVNMKALMARYGEAVVHAGASGKETNRQFEKFVKSLFEVERLTIDVDLRADAYLVSFVSQPANSPGRDARDPLPELVRYLPEAAVRMAFTGRFLGRNDEMMSGLVEGLPEVRHGLEEVVRNADKLQGAMTIDLSQQKFMHFSQILLSSDPAVVEAMQRRAFTANSPETLAAMEKKYAMACSADVKEVRRVEGWPVVRSVLDCRHTDPKRAASVVHRLYPLVTELVRAGSYLLSDINGTPEELDQMVHHLVAGTPMSPPLRVAVDFPESSYLDAEIDVGSLIRSLGLLFPSARLGSEVPPSMVTLTAFESAGATIYRARIPKSAIDVAERLFTALGAALKKPSPAK